MIYKIRGFEFDGSETLEEVQRVLENKGDFEQLAKETFRGKNKEDTELNEIYQELGI